MNSPDMTPAAGVEWRPKRSGRRPFDGLQQLPKYRQAGVLSRAIGTMVSSRAAERRKDRTRLKTRAG
jgi:hypothetical protein